MNKTIMFLGMLAVGFANAQQTNNYDGKVGINTDKPKATLNIRSLGNTDKTKSLEIVNVGGERILTVLDNGNFGISNPQPEDPFAISDKLRFNYFRRSSGLGIAAYTSGWARGYNFTSIDGATNFGGFGAYGGNNTLEYFFIGNDYQNPIAKFVASNKNVGIGTNVPDNKLHIKSDADPLKLEGLQLATGNEDILVTGADGVVKKLSKTIVSNDILWERDNDKGIIKLKSTTAGTAPRTMNNVFIKDNGKVGIGTDDPKALLTLTSVDETYSGSSIYQNIIKDGAIGAEFSFNRARGTRDNPLPVQPGDEIAHLAFNAHHGIEINGKTSNNVLWFTGSIEKVDPKVGAVGVLDLYMQKPFTDPSGNPIRRSVMRIHNNGNVGIGRGMKKPLAPLHIQTDGEDILPEEEVRGQKNAILISVSEGGVNQQTKERIRSIASVGSATHNSEPQYHSIDLGMLFTNGKSSPFLAFGVSPSVSDETINTKAVEHMRILDTGNIGIGTKEPKQKLEVAGAIKVANSTDNTCDTTKAGTIRFVAETKKFQGCTGTGGWVDLH